MNEKKLRKSPIAIACYVISALLLIYTVYSVVSAAAYLSQYFAAYGSTISANLGDSVSTILSSALQPFCFAVVIFVAAKILEELRSQNPIYYVSKTEIDAAKKAKEAKKAEIAREKAEAKAKTEAEAEVESEINPKKNAEEVEGEAVEVEA